jgi:hypothetical protein
MSPISIERAYIEYMDLMAKVQKHDLELSPKGDHVFKNTWLCAAAHFWSQFQQVLAIDSEESRAVRMKEIGHEIENAGGSKKFQEFHKICFPDVPVKFLAATWTCSGRAIAKIGLPVLKLPPSKRRTMLWRGIDLELIKLKTLWMVPIGDPNHN